MRCCREHYISVTCPATRHLHRLLLWLSTLNSAKARLDKRRIWMYAAPLIRDLPRNIARLSAVQGSESSASLVFGFSSILEVAEIPTLARNLSSRQRDYQA
jgi:hypothetical protein